jgi:hypothetical protein
MKAALWIFGVIWFVSMAAIILTLWLEPETIEFSFRLVRR